MKRTIIIIYQSTRYCIHRILCMMTTTLNLHRYTYTRTHDERSGPRVPGRYPDNEYFRYRVRILQLCLRVHTYGRVCIWIRRQPDVLRAIDWPTRRRCPAEDGSVAGPVVVCRTGVYAADCPRATPPNPPQDLRHWASDGSGTSPLVLRPLRFRSGVVSAAGAVSAGRTGG